MLAGQAAVGGGLRRRGTDRVGQAGELGLAVEDEHVVALVGEQVLREERADLGEPLDDGGEAALALAVERRAGADEDRVVAIEDPPLLVVEPEGIALVVKRLHPGEERARS